VRGTRGELINSTEEIPSWETNSHIASQEFPAFSSLTFMLHSLPFPSHPLLST
jgi:hypothetical protein